MNLVSTLKDLLKSKNYTVSYVAKAINVSNATLNLWLNKKYTGNVKKVDDAIKNFIEIEKLRENRIRIGFVKTTIVDRIFDTAKTCNIENEIGVCYGNAGLGKTFAVKRYTNEHSNVILVEADLGYTPKVLFSEIHKKLGYDGLGTIHGLFTDIINKLKSSGRLIIIDEAEHLPYKSLELLRRIYDKANVGILLVGMPRLIKNLKGEKGQYAQLYSRVGISTQLEPLVADDIKAIISSVIPSYKGVYPVLANFCGGNTRVLAKILVRAIRIAELNNICVNEEVIKASIGQIIVGG